MRFSKGNGNTPSVKSKWEFFLVLQYITYRHDRTLDSNILAVPTPWFQWNSFWFLSPFFQTSIKNFWSIWKMSTDTREYHCNAPWMQNLDWRTDSVVFMALHWCSSLSGVGWLQMCWLCRPASTFGVCPKMRFYCSLQHRDTCLFPVSTVHCLANAPQGWGRCTLNR